MPTPLDDLMGLGGLMPGAEAAPQGPGPWSSFLADPTNQAALLGFGIQAMTGGWGNGTQQLGAAMGAGATARAGAGEAILAETNRQDETRRRSGEAAAGRSNQLEVARIGADSRAEVANIRGEYRMAAQREALNKAGPALGLKYRTEARKVIEGNINNMSLPQMEREMMIEELANRSYLVDEARGRTGQPGGGAPATSGNLTDGSSGPGSGPAAKGENPPGKPKSPGMVSDLTGGSADIGLFPPRAIIGDLNVKFNQMKNDPKHGERFRQMLSTPEGRAQLRALNPELTDKIGKD